MPQKDDRRVRRTERLLRDALIALVLERGWEAVSVRDVCGHADVGRSTFYLHFADKEDLLLSGFDELHALMTEHVSNAAGKPFAFVAPLIAHALEHQLLFRAVAGRQSGQLMRWRFRDVLVRLLCLELDTAGAPAAQKDVLSCFLAGGFLEMMVRLLDAPTSSTPVQFAEQFNALAWGAIQATQVA